MPKARDIKEGARIPGRREKLLGIADHLAPYRFKPGEIHNPGGRPKEPPKLRELCKKEGANCLKTLIEIRDSPDVEPSIRAKVANDILDRGFGKVVAESGEYNRAQSGPYLVLVEKASTALPMIDVTPQEMNQED